MTKDQIDELMRENGIVVVGEAVYVLCNLVEEKSAAAEREACAEVAEQIEREIFDAVGDPRVSEFKSKIATAIRARGQHD